MDSTGVKRSEYIKESAVSQVTYTTDLLGVDTDNAGNPSSSTTSALDDLLGVGSGS